MKNKELINFVKLIPNHRGKAWVILGLLHLSILRLFALCRFKNINSVDILIVGYGRYDNNGVSTWDIFQKAVKQGLSCIFIEDLYWHSDSRLIRFRKNAADFLKNNNTSKYFNLAEYSGISYYSTKLNNLNAIKNITFRSIIFFRQCFLLNKLFCLKNINTIVMGNDSDYLPRYICFLGKYFNIPSHLIQISGSNEVYKDAVPFYPMFADKMLTWGSYHAELYRDLYLFDNDAQFIPIGNPKMDKVFIKSKMQKSIDRNILLVISNTQFYSRDSAVIGDQLFVRFGKLVLTLIEKYNSKGKTQVLVKLHPREQTNDLYESLPNWSKSFKRFFVKNELLDQFQKSVASLSLGSTAIFEGLLCNVPAIVFGDPNSSLTVNGPWCENSILVRKGLIELFYNEEELEKRISKLFSNTDPQWLLNNELLFSNLGNSAEQIINNLFE